MENNIDLIKAAEERKYVKFEELALDALKDKLENHPKVQEFKAKLQEIKEAVSYKDSDKEEMVEKKVLVGYQLNVNDDFWGMYSTKKEANAVVKDLKKKEEYKDAKFEIEKIVDEY